LLTHDFSAHNPFNKSQVEPYTGRLEINDYLRDLQLPQMIDVVEKYEAELMVRRLWNYSDQECSIFRSGVILEVQI
jgi:hypothetical protein